jgi:hypothetical protein
LVRWLSKRSAYVQAQRKDHMTWFTVFTITRYIVTCAGCVFAVLSIGLLTGQNDRVSDRGIPDINHVQLRYTSANCFSMTTARKLVFVGAPMELTVSLWMSVGGYTTLIVVELGTFLLISRILRPRAKRQFIKHTVRDIEEARRRQEEYDANNNNTIESVLGTPDPSSADESTGLIRPDGGQSNGTQADLLSDRDAELCRTLAAEMANSADAQKKIALYAWRDAVKEFRPVLLALLLLFTAVCFVIAVCLRRTTLAACCLPASCTNVDGLNGHFPASSARAGQCVLTAGEATALRCSRNSTSIHPPNCTMTTGFCNTGTYSHVRIRIIGAGVAAAGVLVVIGLAHPSQPLQWRGTFVVFVATLVVVLFMGFVGIDAVFNVTQRNGRVLDNGIVQNNAVFNSTGRCVWQAELRQLTYIGAPAMLPIALWAALAGYGLIVVTFVIAAAQTWMRFRPVARRRYVEESAAELLANQREPPENV